MEKQRESAGLRKSKKQRFRHAKYMQEKKLPSLKEIQEVKEKFNCLTRRTAPQIKTWLHNKQKAARALCIC